MSESTIPHQSYGGLFLRFLRFGFLAWGGPVAQIAMIKQELVTEEKWISPEQFNRALAVYQALPGPEAHELCVHFGMLARGRIGAILAGLGFMLPGFVLMFALSWIYVTFGIRSPLVAAAFHAMQAVVVALVVRAVYRIGQHALTDPWLWGIGLCCGVGQFFGVHFALLLLFAGLGYALLVRKRHVLAAIVTAVSAVAAVAYVIHFEPPAALAVPVAAALQSPTHLRIFISGLLAGLLTFGGAYTAIPYVRRDAVTTGSWMTDAQFLDGLALSGILPAPLIIFTTFVGYIAGGPVGAVLMTVGVFLPAFAFTLIGHDFFERVTRDDRAHAFLAGIMAGVVGLIAAAAVALFRSGVGSVAALVLFGAALITVQVWRAKWAVAIVVLAAAAVGLLIKT